MCVGELPSQNLGENVPLSKSIVVFGCWLRVAQLLIKATLIQGEGRTI